MRYDLYTYDLRYTRAHSDDVMHACALRKQTRTRTHARTHTHTQGSLGYARLQAGRKGLNAGVYVCVCACMCVYVCV